MNDPQEIFGVEWEECYRDPWPLSTPSRVAWANEMRDKSTREWRLGDHCFYRPTGIMSVGREL